MVRLGIVGIGIIANDYIGLIAAGRVPHIQLTALCSRSQEKMDKVSSQYNLSMNTYLSYEQMLLSGNIDAVLICTPHGQHPEMTRKALESGIHVLVEKPVGIYADTVEKCVELLKQKQDIVCGVMYNRRASKAYGHIRKVVAAGEIGEIIRCTWLITNLYRTNAYYGTSQWRGSWETEGGGILMTQASHQLDLMQWICGMPCEVLARCATVNRPIIVENEAELFLSYPNGARGHFIASAHECPGTNLLEICGTKGRISVREDSIVEITRLNQDEREFARNCPLPFAKAEGQTETLVFDDSDNKLQQAATIENFALAVLRKAQIQCSLEEGLGSLQIIHGTYVSWWSGTAVKLPVGEAQFRQWMPTQPEIERQFIR